MNNIFKPKSAINLLSSSQIDKKQILYLGLTIGATALLSFFSFGGDILKDFIMVIKESLKPLNDIHGSEKTAIIFRIIRDLSVMFIIFVFIYFALIVTFNWVLKIILGLFKKEISLYKLLNITIYVILYNRFLIFILSLVFAILYPIIKNIPDNQITSFVIFPGVIINIITLVIFIYGVKISIKNKTKSINNSPLAN